MTRIPTAEAGRQLQRLVSQVAESHQPIHITGTDAKAVLIAEDDWRAVQETLFLLSVPGMRESVIDGLRTPVEECARELALDWPRPTR